MEQSKKETAGTIMLQKKVGSDYLIDLSNVIKENNLELKANETLKIIRVKKVMFRQVNDIKGISRYVNKETELTKGKPNEAFFDGVWITTSYKALNFLTTTGIFPNGINEDDEKFVNLHTNPFKTSQRLADSLKIPMLIIKMDVDNRNDYFYKFNAICKVVEVDALQTAEELDDIERIKF